MAQTLAEAAAVANAGSGRLSGSGFTGSAQAGYNWQRNNLVYGVEADFGVFDIKASRAGSFVFPGNGLTSTVTNSMTTDWLFTARGRFGWTFSNVLVYATGGLAVTRLHAEHSYYDLTPFLVNWGLGDWSASKTKAGWTDGGGAEVALHRNWSVKVEYLYLNFGSVHAAGTITAPNLGPGYAQGVNTSVDLTAHVARAGINFRF